MTAATTTPPVRQPLIKSRALRRFLSHKLAMIGLFMVLGLTFACFVGPYLLPYDELYIDLRARFAPPGTGGHIFGTDPLGRDLAARLFHAGQISMAVGFAVMVIATTVGSVVGVVSGYYGGKISAVLMRVVDAFLSFPSVFLLLALAAFIQPGPVMIAVIISATSWMEVARIVEAEVKSLRNQDFVQAAHMLGMSGRWIMFRELLPNAIGPIIVAASLTVARAILLEAYISFLGYGIQPPLPSWGNLLNGAQQYLGSAPWLAIVPGLAITIAVTGFNFIGDGLRDAFDSRAQGQ
ncbi:ABC transporter permease [Pseudosulfitobacter pseudonitzschiae]|uniref:ABC transporter permease n=1 Tax=Pseudosulfitobacter pseudonitzschiae TaxID=1402135 RepID=UPI001AFA7AFA|nr:ABC transporter permease [Pseudosulfitobacter pseudonitzschiae]MBM1816016.1 ABC transporter permease [Pseudosulfitobacter pseudonitzschiae]MBM1833322.1 ABC transporter permease [Pseudosulfitobacter pseudonitzschiae]MBM1838189.1 ABC transporter permease [Pseudosulfitobacter pseudonitzschiae]MBM1842721.1 ABC transporter permease [Pseudosulfitobacter pseudonitzschiae]MBM1847587.1 ABC transporter permease [Pseudosulfitobacter pseudonitzschiae]